MTESPFTSVSDNDLNAVVDMMYLELFNSTRRWKESRKLLIVTLLLITGECNLTYGHISGDKIYVIAALISHVALNDCHMSFCSLALTATSADISLSLTSFSFDQAPVALLHSEAKPNTQQMSMNSFVGLY